MFGLKKKNNLDYEKIMRECSFCGINTDRPPEVFEDTWFALIPEGWRSNLYNLCYWINYTLNDYEYTVEDFVFLDIKEKYGKFTCYYQLWPNKESKYDYNEVLKKIDYIITVASIATNDVCIKCGYCPTTKFICGDLPVCEKCFKKWERKQKWRKVMKYGK